MLGHDIIVIGASSGGLAALRSLVAELPGNLNAAVFVVLHIGAARDSRLPEILSRAGKLPALHPREGQKIAPGYIFVAPPDEHLMMEDGQIRLVRGPKENHARPAIDPLFRSAALAYGPRVLGVVLSGYLDDGAAGLLAVKDRGGVALVQDPAEADARSMPESALAAVQVDHCLPAAEIGKMLVRYDPPSMPHLPPVPPTMVIEHTITLRGGIVAEEGKVELLGFPSGLTCPECRSLLYELKDPRLLRFRCRSGHALSAKSLRAAFADASEEALWSAMRVWTEEAALTKRLAEEATKSEAPEGAALSRRAACLMDSVEQMRSMLSAA